MPKSRLDPADGPHAFDYVVVGAGSAGSTLAARLSEDADVSVLVIEAGPPDRHYKIHLPPGFVRLFNSDLDWDYLTEPEPGCHDRRLYWPRGRVVGGSGSLNAQLYVRGHRRDYDRWRDDHGCPGWGWDDVLPYFKRSEDQVRGASELHGTGGPWAVRERRFVTTFSERFVDAGEELGWPRTDDFNGPHQTGFGIYQVNQLGGKRQSPARAFLVPNLDRSNLHLLTDAQVTRVVVETDGGAGPRARGVELVHGRKKRRTTHRVEARREVILCGGTVNSPQVLLLSGIGDADELRRHGIDVVHQLPAVGRGLQDHLLVSNVFRSRRDRGLDNVENLWNLLRWFLFKTGPLTTTVCEAGAFLRTRDDLPQPDLQFHFLPGAMIDHGRQTVADHGFNIGATLIKPKSRGRVGLRSADPLEPAKIEARYLTADGDLELLVEGVKIARRLATTRAFAADLDAEVVPGADVQTDDEIDDFVRRTCDTLYHPTSTCAMGPPGDATVVDPGLRVHGVAGLRVVDASVMPEVPGGNTNAPTVMVAERAADLVRGRGGREGDDPGEASSGG